MANKPGRLYRKLRDIPKPLFRVNTLTTGDITDDSIQSITIHRGKAEPGGGVSPSTCEVVFSDYAPSKAGETLSILVSGSAATALGGLVGQGAQGVAPRYSGRVGKQEVEDLGNYTRISTITAASWTAQLENSPQKFSFASGTNIGVLLKTILEPSQLPKIDAVTYGTFDRTWGAITDQTYSDLIGKFAGDIGILIRESRTGGTDILPMPYRRDTALSLVASSIPLARSQVLSPVHWDQPNEGVPIVYRLQRRDVNGNVTTVASGTIDGTSPVEDLDWTYFREYTDQWFYIHAMRSQGFEDRFRLTNITIDLLHLMSSENSYHRTQAGKLLTLNPGDPVFLSGDWPSGLDGIYFVEGITETIDSETWQLDLSIINFRESTGQYSPEIPAKIWNSARYAWNSETRKWNET